MTFKEKKAKAKIAEVVGKKGTLAELERGFSDILMKTESEELIVVSAVYLRESDGSPEEWLSDLYATLVETKAKSPTLEGLFDPEEFKKAAAKYGVSL